MGFQKRDFTLFFSLPLDAVDWRNLEASTVRTVMLCLEFADTSTLARLAGMGCRVYLRVNEGSYYQDDAPLRIAAHVAMAREVIEVVGVFVGCEPENALDFSYTSNTYGAEFAYVHRRRFDAVRIQLQKMGVRVISPAQTCRSISEDEQPVPGSVTWREICCLPEMAYTEAQGRFGYLSADGNGVHVYQYAWDGPVDELRLKFMLKQAANLWHKLLYIDELGVSGNATQVQKMAAYIEVAEILLSQRDGRQHPLGQRVAMLCPFVSGGDPGNPPSWDRRFLIRDEAAYRLVADWLRR